jgi:hypothetical protein
MGGYHAILSIEKEEIREKVEQQIIKSLKKSDLICIIANAENISKIEWERPEKEFSFEGDLYDVVYSESVCGITHYYCLRDIDETKLKRKIDILLENQTERLPVQSHSKLILNFLSEPSLTHQSPTFYFKYFINQNTSIFPDLIIFFTSNFVSKLKQPPQFS